MPSKLSLLEKGNFIDAEEEETQEGWLLCDALNIVMNVDSLSANTEITVFSSSREKSVDIPWADIADPTNMVIFTLSGRGAFKLVLEKFPYLDIRDEWVQDVDKIEVWF